MKDHVALVIRRGDSVLFIQRSLKKEKLPGVWAFASGTREDDETLEETAIREAKEELDVEVAKPKLMAARELPELGTRLHFMQCELAGGEPSITAPNEIEQFRWMTFPSFFGTFNDEEIGHGLRWLRANPEIWQ